MSKAQQILIKISEASELEFSCMWDDIISEFEYAFDGDYKIISTGKEVR